MNRRTFFAWIAQLLPQPPRGLQQIQMLTCPLGHQTLPNESAFSASTYTCSVCGVYFHKLPLD